MEMVTFKDLSPESTQLLAFYDTNYEILTNIELSLSARQKLYLGNRENRNCRYCGATAKNVFRRTAHTIPEAVGNKCLISADECDDCNEKFGRLLDEHFTRFLGLHRTVHQISGKQGVPEYGVPGRRPKLRRLRPNQFIGEAQVEDNFMEIDLSAHTGKIQGYKQPYIKRSVFKCLTKIALAILPANELENFESTLAWIRQSDPARENPSHNFYCFTSTMDVKRDGIDLLLLRRRDIEAKLPYLSFYLCFSTLTFQIFLPFCKKDHHLVGEIVLQRFPNLAEKFANVQYDLLDLSSPETVRGEIDHVGFEIGEPGIIIERQDKAQ